MATASVPVRLPKLFTREDDFELWLKRFEMYASITKLKGDVKIASLLSLLDERCFRLYEMVELSQDEQEDYDTVTRALRMVLQKHTTSEPELRYTFVQRRQQETEDAEEFGNALVELANKAYKQKSKDLRQELIRDQFIQGLRDDYIQERLLQEHPETYAQALMIARTLESARKARKALRQPTGKLPVNAVDRDLVQLVKETAGRVVEEEVSGIKENLSSLVDELKLLRVNTRQRSTVGPDPHQHNRSRSPYRRNYGQQRPRSPSPYQRNGRNPFVSYGKRNSSPYFRQSVSFNGYTSDGTVICYDCGQPGHTKRYCPTSQQQTHLNWEGPV